MTRVTPLKRDDHPDLDEKFFTPYEQTRGYVPNSNLVMARRPKLLAAFRAFNAAVFDPDNIVPKGVLALVGNIASRTGSPSLCPVCCVRSQHGHG
jgi:hypothetical protein